MVIIDKKKISGKNAMPLLTNIFNYQVYLLRNNKQNI